MPTDFCDIIAHDLIHIIIQKSTELFGYCGVHLFDHFRQPNNNTFTPPYSADASRFISNRSSDGTPADVTSRKSLARVQATYRRFRSVS